MIISLSFNFEIILRNWSYNRKRETIPRIIRENQIAIVCPVEFWTHRNHFGTITWHASSVNIKSTPATSVFGGKLICSNLFSHTKQPLNANKVFYQSAFAAATYVCNAVSRVRARLWHQPVGNTFARSSKLSPFENQRNKDN